MNTVRFDTLTWSGDHPVVNLEPPLSGWTEIWGSAFDHQPVFGDAYAFRGDDTTKVGFEGNWWIGTAERFDGPLFGYRPGYMQGDGPRGAIRSETFTVTGRSMNLLVGGGNYPDSCFVALIDAVTGEKIYTETGRGVEEMDLRTWNLEPLIGQRVYIEIVDDCSSPMGHINVDSIEESPSPPSPRSSTPLSEVEKAPEASVTETSAAAASKREKDPARFPSGEVSCHPNPFNPVTTISFSASPESPVEVVVFSISGRRIRSQTVISSADGRGSIVWDGRSDSGRPVASGIYAAAAFDDGRIVGMTKLVLLR
jgi:hypothetical protein